MNLEPLEDVAIQIAGTDGIELQDVQNEPADVAERASVLAQVALRGIIKRMNPDFIPCADRGPSDVKEVFNHAELGEIYFTIYDTRDNGRELLGVFWIYNFETEINTPDALAVRASVVPMFESTRPESLADPQIRGLILRQLMSEAITFASGRLFQVIEWVFPEPENQRPNRPGAPDHEENLETLRVLRGGELDEHHTRDDFEDGNPRRVRHNRAATIKSELRRHRRPRPDRA
jgi:hypothetical protein